MEIGPMMPVKYMVIIRFRTKLAYIQVQCNVSSGFNQSVHRVCTEILRVILIRVLHVTVFYLCHWSWAFDQQQ